MTKEELEAREKELAERERKLEERERKLINFDDEQKGDEELDDKDPFAELSAEEKKSTNVNEILENLRKEVFNQLAHINVRLVEHMYPDMDLKDEEYRTQLKAVTDKNPALSIEEAHKEIQKERKLAQLEEKEKESLEEGKRKEEDRAAAEKGGVPNSLAEREDLTEDEAVSEAYTIAFGGSGEG